MTKKQRWFAYEFVAAALVGFMACVALPPLVSARDTVAVVAGVTLLLAYFGWAASLVYRFNKITGA